MNKKRIYLLVLVLLIVSCEQGNQSSFSISQSQPQSQPNKKNNIDPQVIYGEDNRRDLYEIVENENLLSLSNSTLGLIRSDKIRISGNQATIDTSPLNLCSSERFNNQQTGPFCSGFLVSEDLVVTAGHCIKSQIDCESIKFVFDFSLKSSNNNLTRINSTSVYSCSHLVDRVLDSNQGDWAIVKLDRPVLDREPLKINLNNPLSKGTPLTLIGHPSGLPLKISQGGQVQEVYERYFSADIDSYGGNSGSPVFNSSSHEVEGILVRGRQDYVYNPLQACYESNICEEGTNGSCTSNDFSMEAEHVTLISELTHLIPSPVNPSTPSEPESYSSNLLLSIPDNSFMGVTSSIINVPEIKNIEDLKIFVNIEHAYIGDLVISLISPDNKKIILHNKSDRSQNNIHGTYGFDLEPVESFYKLGPTIPSGKWQLKIIDTFRYDAGLLIGWEIIF